MARSHRIRLANLIHAGEHQAEAGVMPRVLRTLGVTASDIDTALR